MYVVYVLDEEGRPLMPTRRFGKVRRMLRDKLAKVVSVKPFVIQLLYKPKTHITQPLHGGIDPGRKNIGMSVINDKGEILYSSTTESRNWEIPKLMAERKVYHQTSRRGERLRRKRRAKKYKTTTTFPEGRKLPGYKNGILTLKDIINTQARFNNRKRSENWITPTVRQCIQTHISLIRQICKFLPVTDWNIEHNKFAFMKMEDGTVKSTDYQNGRLKTYKNVNDYIWHLQNGKCAICDSKIEHYHHIVQRTKGGSNRPDNIIGLCRSCHVKVHSGKASLKEIGEEKKYAHLSVLNQAIPFICYELEQLFGEGNLYTCSGYETYTYREIYKLDKTHNIDAACIAAIPHDIEIPIQKVKAYKIRQYRNHNRQIIHCQKERTYKLGKEKIAKNRKRRTDQKELSFNEWYKIQKKSCSKAKLAEIMKKLTVIKSIRAYNNMKRLKPGSVFVYAKPETKKAEKPKQKRKPIINHSGSYILKGAITNGKYYKAEGYDKNNFSAKNCRFQYFKSLLYI